jgi:hypothetical protein
VIRRIMERRPKKTREPRLMMAVYLPLETQTARTQSEIERK